MLWRRSVLVAGLLAVALSSNACGESEPTYSGISMMTRITITDAYGCRRYDMAESGVFDRDRRQVPVGIAYRTAFGGFAKMVDHKCKAGTCSPWNGMQDVTQ